MGATGRIVVRAVHARKNHDHGISPRDVLVAINNTNVAHLAASKKPRTNEIVQHLNSITKKKARFYLGGNTVGTEFRPLYVVVHQALTFRFSTTTTATTRLPAHHTPNPNPKHETSRSITSSSSKHLKQKKKRKTKTVPVASSLPYKHRQRQQQGALYQNNNNKKKKISDQYDSVDDNKDNDNITAATRSAITATTRKKWSAWEHDQFVEALKASNNLEFDR